MVRRLLLGLVLGLVVGGLVAAGLVAGLGVATFSSAGGAILAYATAAVSGVLTGLVAGKPIWSSGAKVEAGLKALFGALAGAGLMFALRRWAGALPLDLPAIGAMGQTAVGDLPAVSLPLLAGVLGGFFELDNTGGGEGAGKGDASGGRRRVAIARDAKVKPRQAAASDADVEDEPELISTNAKR
jgi:hypothetical protein